MEGTIDTPHATADRLVGELLGLSEGQQKDYIRNLTVAQIEDLVVFLLDELVVVKCREVRVSVTNDYLRSALGITE